MRRLIIGVCLFFIVSQAFAANAYVNNTLIYSGTAVSTGTTTTIIMNAAFTASGIAGGALVDNDPRIRYMGLFVTGGTGASQNHHKISAYNATTHTITFATALSGNSDNTTTFDITYGCDSNTGASETVGATNVGPRLTIQAAYDAAGGGDAIWIKASNQIYTEREKSNAAQQYLHIWRGVANITLEGYATTIGDLNTNPSSTYVASTSNAYSATNGQSVLLPAGYAVSQLALPTISPMDTTSNCNTFIGDATLSTIFRALRFLGSGTRVIGINNTGTDAVITFDQCYIGDGSVASQYGILELQTTGTVALVATKCRFYTRFDNIFARAGNALTVTDSYLITNNVSGSVSNIALQMAGTSPTVAYNSTLDEWYATNQIKRIVIDSNYLNQTTDAAFCSGITISDAGGSTTVGPSWVDHVRITRNWIRTTRASPILCMTLPSLEVGYNECYTDSSSGGGTIINLAPDAAPTTGPGSQHRKIIRRAVVAAGASGSVTLDASASGTNNAYRYRRITVYKADGSAVQTRPLNGYTGATQVATYAVDGNNPTMSPAPASGDIYEVYEERPQTILIHNNYCRHQQDVSGNTHGMLIGQGWDGVRVWNNTIINSDNGIVAKGNYPVIFNNKVYSGRGSMLVKGSSWGTCINNTFMTARAQGGGGVLDIQDKSSVSVSIPTPWLFRDKWSKSTGWLFLDNIFANKGQAGVPIILDNPIDAGTWTAPATLDAAAQKNYWNFNAYAMDVNGDGVFDGGVSNPMAYMDGANVNSLAAMQAKWADTTYQQTFNLHQDANSNEGSLIFREPQKGDFTVIGGSARKTVGSNGKPVGACRQGASRNPFIFAN